MDSRPIWDKQRLEADDFDAAFRLYAQRMYRFLYWRTGDQMLSEDLTTSTFEKAWRSRRNFHGGSLQAWLYQIARNLLIDYWRKKKDVPIEDAGETAETGEEPGEIMDRELTLQKLHQAIRSLQRNMRLVIELRFVEGLPTAEVARRLHTSQNNVRVIQYRALQQLRKML